MFGKYWLSQCFDAKGEWLVGLLRTGIPLTASRGQRQATFIKNSDSILIKIAINL